MQSASISIITYEQIKTVYSKMRKTWLELETHHVSRMSVHRKNWKIRAEVNFVNAEEAKELVAAEGYAVLDVRDKSQFDRAHIRSCHHFPLFIENQDYDLGKNLFTCSTIMAIIQVIMWCSLRLTFFFSLFLQARL